MNQQQIHEQLQNVQRLNANQYQIAQSQADKVIKKKIGDKPVRDSYEREFSKLWQWTDILLIIVFVGAFFISMTHVFDFARIEAVATFSHTAYEQSPAGIGFDKNLYAGIHQLGFLLLAEFAMLSFFTYWGVERKLSSGNGWTSLAFGSFQGFISLMLGIMAFAFVLTANLSSGLPLLMAVIPPAVLLGVGFRLENLVIETTARRNEVDKKYQNALRKWEIATEDPRQHDDYLRVFRQSVFDRLTKLKANSWLVDADAYVQFASVQREMSRENVFSDSNLEEQIADLNLNGSYIPTDVSKEDTAPDGEKKFR